MPYVPRMAHDLRVGRTVAAEPGVVWNLLARTDHWPAWGPSVRAVEPADAEVTPGLTGRVRTAAGPWLAFRIDAVDPGRSWTWTVAGVRATGHFVDPDPAGCRVTFTVPWWSGPYLGVCAVALRRIERLATNA